MWILVIAAVIGVALASRRRSTPVVTAVPDNPVTRPVGVPPRILPISTPAPPLVVNVPRGIRNKNPGNIRISGSIWLGKIPIEDNTDGSYEQFTEALYGIRAMAKLILNYKRLYGIETIEEIITRWAPESDNNHTDNYIAYVTNHVNVGENVPLDLSNDLTFKLLLEGIIYFENGQNPYDEFTIYEAIELAR